MFVCVCVCVCVCINLEKERELEGRLMDINFLKDCAGIDCIYDLY